MDHQLLRCAFSTADMERLTGVRAWLQAMLDFEAGLARAQAALGIVPTDAAEKIAAACHVEMFESDAIAEAVPAGGNPAIPLVKQLTARVGGEAAGYVHWGATSQDVIDTAAILVLARALPALLSELREVEAACAALAERHRDTVLAGRTLLQQALPISFGLKAAGWLSQLQRCRQELERTRDDVLVVQLGGAVGTLASLGDRGLEVVSALATELELGEPAMPWHTARDRIARVVSALALVGGALGKIAGDVVLLMQTEVAEVAEPQAPGRGGSSTMPHKRNPVASTLALAAVRRLHGLVPTVLGCMLQEHERAAGAWHAEWEPLTEALRLTAAAANQVRQTLTGLDVDAARMARNLDATNGLLMAEAAMMELAPVLGRGEAHHRVERACRQAVAENVSLKEVLSRDIELLAHIGRPAFDRLFDPRRYLGVSNALIDRALNGTD